MNAFSLLRLFARISQHDARALYIILGSFDKHINKQQQQQPPFLETFHLYVLLLLLRVGLQRSHARDPSRCRYRDEESPIRHRPVE